MEDEIKPVPLCSGKAGTLPEMRSHPYSDRFPGGTPDTPGKRHPSFRTDSRIKSLALPISAAGAESRRGKFPPLPEAQCNDPVFPATADPDKTMRRIHHRRMNSSSLCLFPRRKLIFPGRRVPDCEQTGTAPTFPCVPSADGKRDIPHFPEPSPIPQGGSSGRDRRHNGIPP